MFTCLSCAGQCFWAKWSEFWRLYVTKPGNSLSNKNMFFLWTSLTLKKEILHLFFPLWCTFSVYLFIFVLLTLPSYLIIKSTLALISIWNVCGVFCYYVCSFQDSTWSVLCLYVDLKNVCLMWLLYSCGYCLHLWNYITLKGAIINKRIMIITLFPFAFNLHCVSAAVML